MQRSETIEVYLRIRLESSVRRVRIIKKGREKRKKEEKKMPMSIVGLIFISYKREEHELDRI